MNLTPVTTSITAAVGDVTTIGLAVLSVVVGIAAFRWIRRAIG